MVRIEPTSSEINLQHNIEKEFFKTRTPIVLYYARTRNTHTNLDIDVDDSIADPVKINTNWDSQKRLKELRDGVYVETKKIELRFSQQQLDEKGITLKKGDLIEFDRTLSEFNTLKANNPGLTNLELFKDAVSGDQELYEILQTKPDERIRNTDERLHLIATINLEHTWSP